MSNYVKAAKILLSPRRLRSAIAAQYQLEQQMQTRVQTQTPILSLSEQEEFRALQAKTAYLEEVVKYLYYEASESRSKLRYLLEDNANLLPLRSKTLSSFDYQWGNITDGPNLLSDPKFREECIETICRYTALDRQWFKDKKILDAGCGQGRFSFGFLHLGAQIVATDHSTHGLQYAKNACGEFASKIDFQQRNLLEPLDFPADFDMVWSYGVLHHTGNTYKAFQNIVPLVKPNGYLFLMLYGEPRWGEQGEFYIQAEYSRLRTKLANKVPEEKINVLLTEKPKEHLHGWFDAVSPPINDIYAFEEIEGWLLDAGFHNIRSTFDTANHHIIAQRKS